MTQGKRTDNYLEQLGKWQAVSNPELAESKPEELFGADDLRRYKSLHDNLLWRLIRLHGTLCTLEELREFPFEYVYGAGQMEFWRLVAANFIETAILKLDSLVNYRGEDVHSLISFRSEI